MCWSQWRLVAWATVFYCNFAATETAKNHRVLAIRAANSEIDWRAVEGFSVARDRRDRWHVEELHLENFGRIMKEKDFQAALEDSEDLLVKRLEAEAVDALLIQSKGVGIASYLVWKGLWKGPIILLSPIPNACEHISGGSWEVEWNSTMNLLVSMEPVAIGTGNSRDEEDFIVDARRIGCAWYPKHPFLNGCFSWMIPNLYSRNGCFTKHPLKHGCLGFQADMKLFGRDFSTALFFGLEWDANR